MTKLCPRGKAAAKRKFKVYPSAYANAYASKICAGKIKDPSGVKRKDFRGPKPSGAKVGMAVSAGSQSALGRLQKSGIKKAKKGRMFTAAEVRALDESTGSKVNPKKKERIMQSGDKDKIKLSKTNLKRYNIGSLVETSPEYRANQKYKVKKRGQKERTLNPNYKGQKFKKEMSFTGKSRTEEVKKPQGMMGGGMARGMGAAIKGGKFEGVF